MENFNKTNNMYYFMTFLGVKIAPMAVARYIATASRIRVAPQWLNRYEMVSVNTISL